MVTVDIWIGRKEGLDESLIPLLKSIIEIRSVERGSFGCGVMIKIESPTVEELQKVITSKICTLENIKLGYSITIESQDSGLSLSNDFPCLFEITSATMKIAEKKDKNEAKLILAIHFSIVGLMFAIGIVTKNGIWYAFGVLIFFLLIVIAFKVYPLLNWKSCEKCNVHVHVGDFWTWDCWNCNHRHEEPRPGTEGM